MSLPDFMSVPYLGLALPTVEQSGGVEFMAVPYLGLAFPYIYSTNGFNYSTVFMGLDLNYNRFWAIGGGIL